MVACLGETKILASVLGGMHVRVLCTQDSRLQVYMQVDIVLTHSLVCSTLAQTNDCVRHNVRNPVSFPARSCTPF